MIIKNNNKAVDVQKERHVCWEGQKTSRRFYVKKTETLIKTEYGSDPSTIPNISWEGGTTQKFNLYRKEIYSIREGFTTRTEERIYNYPNATFKSGDTSGCTINNTSNQDGPYTFNNPFSVTFSKRDNASSDRTIVICAMGLRGDRYDEANITITQTKRDKYVTKLDNATITTDLIPASGGNISSGKLTFRKTYNTGESETVTENITFSTVSATTKGTTESPVTNVTTIPAGGTIQKQTTIDGVTLQHPSFTVKQAANSKKLQKYQEEIVKKCYIEVTPTVVYSSGGTVTVTPTYTYDLRTSSYVYSSGSISGGDLITNQGPKKFDAGFNITIKYSDDTNTSSFFWDPKYTSTQQNKINATTKQRTITYYYTHSVGGKSNEAVVTQKLDGPDESKAFTYSNLKITKFSYATDKYGYHFPASGRTILATDCTLEGTYDWTYTSMENKTVTETVKWAFNDLTANMYTFTPTSASADSLGTESQSANNQYKRIKIDIKDLKHTYNRKQYDVKNEKGISLTASSTAVLTRQGNRIETKDLKTESIEISVSPTSFTYTGGTATLTSKLIKIYNVYWTSGETNTTPEDTDITNDTIFTGVYYILGESSSHTFVFNGNKPVIPNIQSSKYNRTYTFTGRYYQYAPATATLKQTGNTVLHTVTFHINNTYAKWSKTTGNESIKEQFSHDTPYTSLIPSETPTWVNGSNLKYKFLGNYSTTTTGNAVSSTTLLTGDIDLYARWSTDSTGYVKVTWDPNDGQLSPTSGGTSTTKAIYDYHNPGAIKCQPSDIGYKNTPSKTGYTFLGWHYNMTYYKNFPVSITLSTTPIQFNAIYTVTEKTVYWNSNGGTFSDGSTQKSEKKNYGAPISAYSSSPTKTADTTTTYKFKGWSLTPTGTVVTFPYTLTTTNTTFNFYAIYTSSASMCTIYWNNTVTDVAIWSDGTKKEKKSSVEYGTKYSALSAPATLANPIKNDNDTIRYTGAWYTDTTSGTLLSVSSLTVTINPTHVFLILTIVSYKVTFNPYGGTLIVSGKAYTSSNLYITYTKSSFNLRNYTPTRTGNNFKGWSDQPGGTYVGDDVTITDAITYYALWAHLFTVTWNLNGGNISGDTSNKTESIESGSTVSFTKYTPTRTGYTFVGWSTNSSATSGSTSGTATITANTTYYAIWKSATLTPILLVLA